MWLRLPRSLVQLHDEVRFPIGAETTGADFAT